MVNQSRFCPSINAMPVAVEIRERAAPPAQFKRSFKPGAVAIDPVPRRPAGPIATSGR
jgi:hypothetical protein